MGAIENKETIRRIYEALASGDRGEFAAAVHPQYVWRIAGRSSWSRRFAGRESIHGDLLEPLFGLFKTRYTARAVNIVADGDYVVAEVGGQVETNGGKRYDNEYCFVFRFEGDKIVEVAEYCDTDLIERVLGPYEDALAQHVTA